MDLAILAHINRQLTENFSDWLKALRKGKEVAISKFLDKRQITFLNSSHRDEALQALVHSLWQNGKLSDEKSFLQAVLDRESIVSTGIGMGIAIPHAKMSGFEDFFMAVGIHKQGIEWGSLDGLPVKLIFLIGGPENKQTEYLRVLSRLTIAIKDENRRKQMLEATMPQHVIDLFQGC